MSLERRARPGSLAWSNPLAWWWSLLTLVSGANIAVWLVLYRQLHEPRAGTPGGTSTIELMLVLCAAYVFGCAFRSFLPRADVQRICLFDTWLSSGRRRPLGRHRGRNLFRRAMGDHPVPAWHADGGGHHPQRRLGDRAVDPARGMFLLVCGAGPRNNGPTPSRTRSGRRPSSSSGPASAGCCRNSRARFASCSPSRSWDCGLPGVSHHHRCADVSRPMAGHAGRWAAGI